MEGRRGSRWCARSKGREERAGYGAVSEKRGSDTEPTNIFSLMIRLYRMSPALLALHLSGVVIAWFAPDDALTRWPLLKIAVTDVGEIFPLLPEAVKKSRFPDVTALYFLLMLVAVPMRLWVAIRFCYSYRSRIENGYSKISLVRKIYSIFVVLIFMCVGFSSILVDGYFFEWNFVAISRSRMWLGLIGPLFAGGAEVIAIAAGVVVIFIALHRAFTCKEE
ncbi:hypothetical protein BTK96_006202 [Burkholderia pyrrocinia]|nr:hypothetical protein [Burkholderia pyrrocinia]EKS9898088.1 hypothetical protein [Burkholderia pyrrocinia]EKS9909798.1 hypothetical protein [Burkholderia pyrrocinia]